MTLRHARNCQHLHRCRFLWRGESTARAFLAVRGRSMHALFMAARPESEHPANEKNPMDAIKLLKADHKVVRDLLNELADTTPRATKKRADLLGEIRVQLKAHTTIEEEIFYPAFHASGNKSDDAKMFFEALEEHRAAGDLVLPDLLVTDVDSEKFSGRAKVLKELVTHHADEEEKEMFPRAKELLDKGQLEKLGDKLAARKEQLVAELRATDPVGSKASRPKKSDTPK
ncbi:MAG: hemerythrin domain-containing protein [Rhodanobacter sp.]